MSTVPTNREELEYKFGRIVARTKRVRKDWDLDDFVARVIPDLVEAVPVAAFDALQPSDEGVLFYHGTVDEGEVVEFQHDLLRAHMNLEKEVPITLNLSSVGGSVFAGLALISTIQDLQRKGRVVNVHVQGVAMSMGSVIVQVANRRTIEASAFFMLHEVSYGMRGTTSDHEEERKFTELLQDALYHQYSQRTGKPVQYYREKLKKVNWYMTAAEALSEGLVDEVIPAPIFNAAPEPPFAKTRARRKKAA